jgi:hypothetical protein
MWKCGSVKMKGNIYPAQVTTNYKLQTPKLFFSFLTFKLIRFVFEQHIESC